MKNIEARGVDVLCHLDTKYTGISSVVNVLVYYKQFCWKQSATSF